MLLNRCLSKIFCLFTWQEQNKVLKQRLLARLSNKPPPPQSYLAPTPIPEAKVNHDVLKNLRSSISELNQLADKIEYVLQFK